MVYIQDLAFQTTKKLEIKKEAKTNKEMLKMITYKFVFKQANRHVLDLN